MQNRRLLKLLERPFVNQSLNRTLDNVGWLYVKQQSKNVDWKRCGEVIATGTLEEVAKSKKFYTGRFLKEELGQ